jgi:hypothetical protein
MTKKKLSEIRADVRALLKKLPAESARDWLTKEVAAAKRDPNRDAETLEMLCAALEREARTVRNAKPRRKAARRSS